MLITFKSSKGYYLVSMNHVSLKTTILYFQKLRIEIWVSIQVTLTLLMMVIVKQSGAEREGEATKLSLTL